MKWPQAEADDAGKRLEAYLAEKDRSGQLLAIVERGIINRKTLARELNIVYSKLVANAHLKSILNKWNATLRAVGIQESKWDLLPSQVREYLETAHRNNTLPVHWEKTRVIISRTILASHFGFPKIQFTRNAALRAVVEEFDTKIDSAIYQRKSKYDHLEKPLRELCASEDVVLHRGAIDRNALALKLGVRPGVFKFVAKFEQIISDANKAIRLKRLGRELDPYVVAHKRRYDFYRYAPVLGFDFSFKLSQAFAEIATRFASGTSKTHYYILNNFLSFITAKSDLFCQEAKGGFVQRDTLEQIAWVWRDNYLAKKSTNKRTGVSGDIQVLNSILKELADAQVLPEIFPLSSIRNAGWETISRPAFGQMYQGARIHEILAMQGVSQGDQDAWWLSLDEERKISPDLPVEPLEAFKILNGRRLKRLHLVAEDYLCPNHKHFLEGERLISSSNLTGAEIAERVKALTAC